MSEEVASAYGDMRAQATLLAQLGQAHEATLLAQADAETLRAAINRALDGCPFCRAGTCRADAHEWLREAERTAHPGQALVDEVAAARAREAGLKLAADQYSESRDQWMLKAKAAIQRGAADHAVAEAARALAAGPDSVVWDRLYAALAVAVKAGGE